MFKKIILLILCFTILFLSSSGCIKKPKTPKPTRLTIAFQEWPGYGLFYLAQDKGFCAEEGIELIFIDEQLDASRRDAFKEGMLDCEAGTIDLLVSKAAQGTPVVAVMEIDHSSGSDAIVAIKEIGKLEDLIGKRLALTRDDVGETFISTLFMRKGLSLDDVTIVPAMTEDVARIFLSGEVDACVTWEPQVSKALERPLSHVIASTLDYPDIIVDTLNVRKDIVVNNPELVKKLMRSWFKALVYYKLHTDEASVIIAKYYNITPEEYRKQIAGLHWKDYEEQKDSSIVKEWVNIFNDIAQVKLSSGRIKFKPDPDKFLDHTLIEKLYEDTK